MFFTFQTQFVLNCVLQVIKHQHTDDINIGAPKYAYKDEARRFTTNPQADREAIESIDKVFYGDQEDINPYELDVSVCHVLLLQVIGRLWPKPAINIVCLFHL